MSKATELYTRKEVAALLKVKPHTLYKWERRGLIKPVGYVNGRPRYTIDDVAKVPTDKQYLTAKAKNHE